MSLVDKAMVDVVMLDKVSQEDGEGGTITHYQEGAKFRASITSETEGLSKVANAITEKVEYRVVTKKNVTLDYHDVFKRLTDGQVFRVLNKNKDKQAPNSSSLNMRVTFAEEWSLPV